MRRSTINSEIELADNESLLFIMFEQKKVEIHLEKSQSAQIRLIAMQPDDQCHPFWGEPGFFLNRSNNNGLNYKEKARTQCINRLNQEFTDKKEAADQWLELKLTNDVAKELYELIASKMADKNQNIKQSIIDILDDKNIAHNFSSASTSTCAIL